MIVEIGRIARNWQAQQPHGVGEAAQFTPVLRDGAMVKFDGQRRSRSEITVP